jgi:hypothetical protein
VSIPVKEPPSGDPSLVGSNRRISLPVIRPLKESLETKPVVLETYSKVGDLVGSLASAAALGLSLPCCQGREIPAAHHRPSRDRGRWLTQEKAVRMERRSCEVPDGVEAS